MPNRVFLMNPPSGLYRRDDRCQSKVDDQTVRVIFPPVDLGVLAAIARQTGASVMLRDYPTVGATRDAYISDLRGFEPDLVLMNTTAPTMAEDLESFVIAREHAPGAVTIARGEAIAVLAEKTLPGHPELDAVICGEPEETFREILTGRPLAEIQGLAVREPSGTVLRTPDRPLIADLDTIPHPAYDLFNPSLYRSPENGRMITTVHAQRGCPSKCIFCPAGSMFGYTVRERSVPHIMAEITECVNDYGIHDFLFHGDTFTLHKKWLTELCSAIVDSGLDIHWGCNSRVDTIDDERARWLARAGCWVVAFGFEHGVQEMLDRMKKGTRVSRAAEAVQTCRRAGLRVHGFFVIGLPWETRDTLEQTFRFARGLDLDYFDFNVATPLPGTELYDIAEREGLFETTLEDKASYANAGVRTHELTGDELTAWRRRALLRMYARPRYIARTLRHAARDGNTTHYARAAWNRLRSLVGV